MTNYPENQVNKARAEKVVQIIRDYDGVITSKEIQTLMGDELALSTLKTFMSHYVMRHCPEINSIPRRGYIYVGGKPEESAEPEKTEDKSLYKNSEGYIDPTAGKALANLMMASKKPEINQLSGEVWVRKTGSYSGVKEELVLVIGGSRYVVNYIPVKDYDLEHNEYFYADYCVEFYDNGRHYFVDWRQLRTSGQNPFATYKFTVEDDIMSKIREHLANRFSIPRKLEVAVKEVPVEVVKEVQVPYTREDAIKFLTEDGWIAEHDAAINKQISAKYKGLSAEVFRAKAEAWETAFRLMCGKEE